MCFYSSSVAVFFFDDGAMTFWICLWTFLDGYKWYIPIRQYQLLDDGSVMDKRYYGN
jgi:hypothetical protein